MIRLRPLGYATTRPAAAEEIGRGAWREVDGTLYFFAGEESWSAEAHNIRLRQSATADKSAVASAAAEHHARARLWETVGIVGLVVSAIAMLALGAAQVWGWI